jgi:hypothetical protein
MGIELFSNFDLCLFKFTINFKLEWFESSFYKFIELVKAIKYE